MGFLFQSGYFSFPLWDTREDPYHYYHHHQHHQDPGGSPGSKIKVTPLGLGPENLKLSKPGHTEPPAIRQLV